ncbi:pilus assembly protein [Sphingomonas sinipercae]|uniref:Pilus assembly protein n=1 Tax=Sphingomonas sinipercae TaxID=2714944 RepID=A0A6G7ZN52_9SPHN|nr:TadE family protein [Sphingomonas sinipercae]QIL02352.1 pilus assembly protein [Sphingomonas sinipercae]
MMLRRLRLLAREQGGVATIELAMVAPVLALMVVGISDISIAYSRKLELEQASQRAIEKVMQTTGETTPEAAIQKEAVCQINGANADGTCKTGRISASNVTAEYLLKCNGVTTDYSLECATGETELRYIKTTVTDTYTPMFPLKFGTAADGKYHISSTTGVRVG